MGEPGGVAAGGPVLEVELDLARAADAHGRVDRHADLHPVAVGERQHVAQGLQAERPLAGDRRPHAQPARGGPPSARTPARARTRRRPVAKAATASSASPCAARARQRPRLTADSPRSPSHRTTPRFLPPGAAIAPRPHSIQGGHRHAPFPCRPPPRATRAPCSRASSPVPSLEPSSATHMPRRGRRRRGPPASADPVRLVAGGDQHEDARLGRSVGAPCLLSASTRPAIGRWRIR